MPSTPRPAARDALGAGLRERYAAQERRNRATAKANHVLVDGAFPGVDRTGGLVLEDPQYVQAEAIVRLARTDLRQLQREAERSALGRRYRAGIAARNERVAAATTRGRLDRLAGQPSTAEMVEREQSLSRLVRKGGAA